MDAKLESWDDLRFFLEVTRGGSLSAAARALGVNASTVHRRLGGLERRLKVRLFDRTPRAWTLTVAGEELVGAAEQVEEGVLTAERRVAGRDLEASGTVRFTTNDVLAIGLLGPHLRAFRREHPKIDLEISVTPRELRLGRREADVALRPGRRPNEPDIVVKKACTVSYSIYASRCYVREHGAPRGWGDLAGHTIVTGDDSLAHVSFLRYLRERAEGATIAFRSDSVLMHIVGAKHGFGLASLPCFLGDVEPELVRVLEPEEELTVDLWLLVHADVRRAARVQALVSHVEEALRTEAPLLDGRLPGGRSRSAAHARERAAPCTRGRRASAARSRGRSG